MTRRADVLSPAVRPLGESEFNSIRRLAHRTFGLDLQPGKQELVSARLQRLVRANGFRSYQEYYRHVLDDASGESLMALIDALATNHTAFLREHEHFDFLRDTLAPLLRRRTGVDVWSAACSTGEEVWSLGFVLNDVLRGSAIRLVGTDISRKALECCERAVYSAERVSGLPAAWIQNYLVSDGLPAKSYAVDGKIRQQAVFRRMNLIEPGTWPIRFPVIFCRNVMIYFDRPTQRRVVAYLASHLEPGGYLFIGHAESLTGIEHGLEYVRPAVYRKPPAARKDR